jgi:hypothetical protein
VGRAERFVAAWPVDRQGILPLTGDPSQQVTLSAQAIVDASFAPDDDVLAVLGARWRVAF